MERRSGEVSRRDSLKIFGALGIMGGSALLGSCDGDTGRKSGHIASVVPTDQEVQPGWEQNAIFNAASFPLVLNILDGTARTISGHGSIFKDPNGNINLKSVGHIVLPEGIPQRNTNLTVQPAGSLNRFLVDATRINGDFLDPDGIVDVSLPDNLRDFVKRQIDLSVVIPLEAVSCQKLSVGETLVTPGINGALEMVFEGYEPSSNLIVCSPRTGTICKGFSGQAVVKKDGRGVTNMSVGLIDEAHFPDVDLKCTNSASRYFLRPVA